MIKNIIKAALDGNSFNVMLRKVLKRFEKDTHSKATAWANSQVKGSLAEFCASIDSPLWAETLSVCENTKKKIPDETIRLLRIQKDMTIKQLTKFPDLYYAKSHYPLEISQRAFDHLWRMCESYELWCKETKQEDLIFLNIID